MAPDHISVEYVLDLAEIPTVERRMTDAAAECGRVAGEVALSVGGAPVELRAASSSLVFPKGQAGLDTTRLTCSLVAPVSVHGAARIDYRDDRYADRIGWREITAVGDGTTLQSSLRTTSLTDQLRHYPRSMLGHPLDERAASLDARPGGARLASSSHSTTTKPQSRGVDALTTSFTRLVGRHDLGLGIGAIAIVLAVLLGAVHAFAPGHGKTVMAAYLVGRHGSLKQASIVALTVTATHTTGVLLLGVLVSSSALIAPERLYPWLGAASGLMLVAIGWTMLPRRAGTTRPGSGCRSAHEHTHGSAHGHEHHHDHDTTPSTRMATATAAGGTRTSRRHGWTEPACSPWASSAVCSRARRLSSCCSAPSRSGVRGSASCWSSPTARAWR